MRTTKKILITFALLLIIGATTILAFNRKKSYSKVEVYKSEQGWGYDIIINKKKVIHQPYMPAIAGKCTFQNKKAARQTGELVLEKIKKKQTPAITEQELNDILEKNK